MRKKAILPLLLGSLLLLVACGAPKDDADGAARTPLPAPCPTVPVSYTHLACAMMLPIVMEYNAPCTGEKYRQIAQAMGVQGVEGMSQEEYRKAAVEAVAKLSADVGIPAKLPALKEEDLQFLAESAFADACCAGNPRDTSVEELKDLFRKLM